MLASFANVICVGLLAHSVCLSGNQRKILTNEQKLDLLSFTMLSQTFLGALATLLPLANLRAV